MPATVADIAGASRSNTVATWESATIAARYPTARDGSVSPDTGFFDQTSDAQTTVNARGLLIGIERRRFAVKAADIVWPTISIGVPSVQLIDAEQNANSAFLAARVEIDLDAETTTYELFG